MTLKELQIGKSAIVDAVGGAGALRQHFLDMGLIPGAEVTLVKLAPMGDPMELRIHGYELTLRLDDAAQITVTPTEKTPAVHAPVDGKMVEHPGLGEGGKYHTKEGEHPLPEDKTLTFALAGNQNCGKTTLFNQLTGSNQHVGNFPGVTVDRKSGAIKGHPETEVTDLPGIYSMSPYSSEEIVTRQFIIGEKPTGIINIVDATNIERNLYLTMQLMELDTPMVLALNMMDEMRGNGGTVRINKMEAMLGIPVIPISAAKNEGVDELVDHAVHVAKYQERPGRMDFCSEDDHGGAVHRCIHGIIHLIEDHAKAAGIPVRFAATKLVEGDHRIEEALKLDQNEKEMIEHIIVQMEQERGLDRAAAIADMRFSFIQELVAQTVVKPHESKEQLRSNRIDKFLTGKYTAIPAFIAIMGLVFFLTFNVIGLFFQNLMEMGIDALTGVGIEVNQSIIIGLGAVLWIVTTGMSIFFVMNYAKKVKADKGSTILSMQELKDAEETHGKAASEVNKEVKLTGRQKGVLIAFAFTFVVMIVGFIPLADLNEGVANFFDAGAVYDADGNAIVQGWSALITGLPIGQWYFDEASTWFFLMAVLIGIIGGLSEKQIVNTFITGAADMMSVVLVIALARGISVLMASTGLDVYVLDAAANALAGLSGVIFAPMSFLVYFGLSFLIPSTSGMATVSMPIMGPLAVKLGFSPEVMVMIYSAAIGIVNLFTPTSGAIMGGLALAKIEWTTWLKFALKLIVALSVVCAIILTIACVMI